MLLLLGFLVITAIYYFSTTDFNLKKYFDTINNMNNCSVDDLLHDFLINSNKLLSDLTYKSNKILDELGFYDKCPYQNKILHSLNMRYNFINAFYFKFNFLFTL